MNCGLYFYAERFYEGVGADWKETDLAKEQAVDATKAPEKTSKRKKEFKKKREKRVVPHGVAHIQATFNNTIITICGPDGRTVSWSSAGSIGFKGSRKN